MSDRVLKSGDFVIWRKPDSGALCASCRILDDGAWPGYLVSAAVTLTAVGAIAGWLPA